jgi:hypothetical protein
MTPILRALETVSAAWRSRAPLYAVELDDGRVWEFYECGAVRFYDRLEGVEEWAPLWEYGLE